MKRTNKPENPRKRDLAKPIILALALIFTINLISSHQTANFKSVNTVAQNQPTQNSPQQAPQNTNPNNLPTTQSPTEISADLVDENYKRSILRDSGNPSYKIENMSSIVGPYELSNFIMQHNSNPKIYTPTLENVNNGTFRANFHLHTVNSDGTFTIKELLDKAELYAEKAGNGPFYISITDHNTLQGLKEAIDILQTNPQNYKRVKLLLGVELNAKLEARNDVMKKPIEIHVLCWALNPYDTELNSLLSSQDKSNLAYDKNFDNVITVFGNKGLVGIAHPMRYVKSDNMAVDKLTYYRYLISKYSELNSGKLLFAEGYYQSYTTDEEKALITEVNNLFKSNNIILTGSTDSHGNSFFHR